MSCHATFSNVERPSAYPRLSQERSRRISHGTFNFKFFPTICLHNVHSTASHDMTRYPAGRIVFLCKTKKFKTMYVSSCRPQRWVIHVSRTHREFLPHRPARVSRKMSHDALRRAPSYALTYRDVTTGNNTCSDELRRATRLTRSTIHINNPTGQSAARHGTSQHVATCREETPTCWEMWQSIFTL